MSWAPQSQQPSQGLRQSAEAGHAAEEVAPNSQGLTGHLCCGPILGQPQDTGHLPITTAEGKGTPCGHQALAQK